MTDEATIEAGKVVTIDYVLRDPSGAELDRSEEGHPLLYLHGAHNIVPGLEEGLIGRKVGESLEVRVSPDQGYGEKRNVKPKRVLRSKFPAAAKIERGAHFIMQDDEGRAVPIWVKKVQGREVHITTEHPLAGVTLCFDVTIREIRDATDEEQAHGHPHGPGDHHHHDEEE